MKSQKNSYCLLALLSTLSCVPAFAGNGNYLPGSTPISQSMGGGGVGFYSTNSDALFRNPALMSKSSETDKIELGGWIGVHELHSTTDKVGNGIGSGLATNRKSSLIPGASGSYRLNSDLVFGLGYYALGGNKVDLTSNNLVSRIQNDFQISRLIFGASYKISEQVSVGLSPFLTFGSYQLNTSSAFAPSGARSTTSAKTDRGLGVQVGVVYNPIQKLHLGFTYISKSKQTYKEVIDLDSFGGIAARPGLDNVVIDSPTEYALGSSYQFTDSFSLSFDYRRIDWGNTNGYKDLGWSSQNVFTLGGQYAVTNNWKLRLGFNYAKAPQSSVSGENGVTKNLVSGIPIFNVVITRLNAAGYPAYIEKILSAGAGYQVTPNLGLNLAVIVGLKNNISRQGDGTGVDPSGVYLYKGDSETKQVNFGANYTF